MNILLLVCIEGLILERVPGWIEPHGLNGQHVRLAFFWWWGNPYPTLKTIMSQYDAGCIDKVLQVATTQSNILNGRGSTEKFNNDSNPVFNGVTLARPPGADMIVSYHAANWTSVAFCLIGMPSLKTDFPKINEIQRFFYSIYC